MKCAEGKVIKWSLMDEQGLAQGRRCRKGDYECDKQEIYDLWLGGTTTYCGVTASEIDRNKMWYLR